MGRLILVRHGESQGNLERVLTSHPEVPLTDLGRTQAQRAGEQIAATFAPRQLIASPFLRARQTAEIIAAVVDLPVTIEPDLHERGYGRLAGQPYEVARASGEYDPQTFWLWRPPGGESLEDVAVRAGVVLDRLAAASPAEDVVVVSHGGVMLSLWWHTTGVWRPRVAPNAGIVVVEHDGQSYADVRMVPD